MGTPGDIGTDIYTVSLSTAAGATPKTLDSPHQVVTFGRDADRCDIPVRPGPNDEFLLPVAGVIWQDGGALWLRNLSTTHELSLVTTGTRPDAVRRGRAMRIPRPGGRILGPGGCDITVTRLSA